MRFMPSGERIMRISLCVALLLSLVCFENTRANSKILSIGIAVDDSTFSRDIVCFKSGMAELGYIEGKNIRYISYGFIKTGPETSPPEIREVLVDKPDLLFTMGNFSALWAKKATENSGIPCLFSMISSDPVNEGIVESLSLPKGNTTGIRVPNVAPKALEWLVASVPGTRRIFLPYNPADEISALALEGMHEASIQMGVDLVARKISSVEETVTAIETLPEDIDAIFAIPSLNTDEENEALSRAAIKRKLPMGSAHDMCDEILVDFSPDEMLLGKQAARLADKIFRGTDPAHLPIETPEVVLTINLKVAEKIGVRIPNAVLVNANEIIR